MKNDDRFDFQDFRKWMEQSEEPVSSYCPPEKKKLGNEVEPKPGIGIKHLAFRMEVEEGDALVLAREFRDHGGKLLDVDNKLCLVEVASGSFFISKSCCCPKDN